MRYYLSWLTNYANQQDASIAHLNIIEGILNEKTYDEVRKNILLERQGAVVRTVARMCYAEGGGALQNCLDIGEAIELSSAKGLYYEDYENWASLMTEIDWESVLETALDEVEITSGVTPQIGIESARLRASDKINEMLRTRLKS